jgi:hypothetical protein
LRAARPWLELSDSLPVRAGTECKDSWIGETLRVNLNLIWQEKVF